MESFARLQEKEVNQTNQPSCLENYCWRFKQTEVKKSWLVDGREEIMYVCDIYIWLCSVSVDQNILRDYYCYTQAREIGLPVYFTNIKYLANEL